MNNSIVILLMFHIPQRQPPRMPKHTGYLLTFDRGTHPLTGVVKPYHWMYFIETEVRDLTSRGYAFQLRGMPGGFYYPGPETLDPASELGEPKDRLEVGQVDDSDILDCIHEIMADVEIVKDEASSWNCQDWALAGLSG
jgi:hypothetical protein